MIIKYSDNNENRIEWQHRRGGEWKTAELDELIEAYEREKTGKWSREHLSKRGFMYCSECGFGKMDNEHRHYNYCPNCGARMVD